MAKAKMSRHGTLMMLSASPASVAGAPFAFFINPKRNNGPRIMQKVASPPKTRAWATKIQVLALNWVGIFRNTPDFAAWDLLHASR